MTKERLEELIKQRAIIYYASEYTVIELDFDNVITEVCGNTLYCQNGFRFCIKDLFETEEQALWALKTVAERIQSFQPPMWEEIEKGYDFYFYIKDTPYAFHVNKDLQCIEFSRDFMHNIFMKKGHEATKENYEKACKAVKDLFKEDK